MGAIANLHASLDWDIDDFQRGTRFIEDMFRGIIGLANDVADAVSRAGRRMTLGLTLPITGLGVLFTKAAADAAELQSAFDYTFGAMSGRMNRWAEETGDSMGRATTEMQQGALKFGQLFRAAAPTEEAAARMSQRFTELAQDASSFFDTDFDTAMGKIRSGLSGESEPLRDFGIFLNEASVKAKALEMGLVESGQEVNEYGKIMARAALIAEGLADANGDIARTSGSLSNQVRKIKGDLSELATEIGQILEPYAQKLASAVERVVAWFKALPDGVKRAAVGFAVFLAALGPLTVALSFVAITLLPLFLTRLSPVFVAISAVVNPIGTAVVMFGKWAMSIGGLSKAFAIVLPYVGRLAGVVLRFATGPIGLAITAILFFKDEILAAFSTVMSMAEGRLGPAFERLGEAIARVVDKISQVWADFAQSEFGQFVGLILDHVGAMIQGFLEIGGSAVITAFELVLGLLTTLVDSLSFAVEFTTALINGDWSGAWDAAQNYVNNAIANMLPGFQGLWGWIQQTLSYLGFMDAKVAESTNRAGGMDPITQALNMARDASFNLRPETNEPKRSYAVASVPKAGGSGRTAPRGRSRAATGPSAAELAERREALALEQKISVVRERGDLDALRRLERERDLKRLIDRYDQAGLSKADARKAAERDLLELAEAKAEAWAKEVGAAERSFDLQLAELRNDFEHQRGLKKEEYLEERIAMWQAKGVELAEAEKRASRDLLNLEEARGVAMDRRLRDQKAAHDIEVARLRGDRAMADRLTADQWVRDRTDQIYRDSEGRVTEADAYAEAMAEASDLARAQMQGNFRDAARGGLRAAMDGNLFNYFREQLQNHSFNALAKVLDRLADKLADLVFDGGGGSGTGGLIGSIIGALGGKKGGAASGSVSPASAADIPGLNSGGRGRFKGFGGIDKNLLSLNGSPIARVSRGEQFEVFPNGPGQRSSLAGGSSEVLVRLGAGLEADLLEKSAGQTVQIVRAAAPGMMQAASAKTRRDAARPVTPGGMVG